MIDALARFQSGNHLVERAGVHTKFGRYATLAAVIEALRPAASLGLSHHQVLSTNHDGTYALMTTLQYSGTAEKVVSLIRLPAVNMDNPQAFGSMVSYFRRYTLMAVYGLAAEDDNGEAASPAQESAANRDFPVGEDEDLL